MKFGIRRSFLASSHRNKDAPFKKSRKSTIPLEKKECCAGFLMPKKILTPVENWVLHKDLKPNYIWACKNAGIASTKIALARSEVTENQLSITLAGAQPLTTSEWSESGNIDIDRYSMDNNSAVTGYQVQYNADLTFILTASVYGDYRGAVTAFGDLPIDKDSAFAIVDAKEINAPYYTFTHEFGHLFGARHEGTNLCANDGDDSGFPDAHGYRFHKSCNGIIVQRKDYYTLMSTKCIILTVQCVTVLRHPIKMAYPFSPTLMWVK